MNTLEELENLKRKRNIALALAGMWTGAFMVNMTCEPSIVKGVLAILDGSLLICRTNEARKTQDLIDDIYASNPELKRKK